MSKSKSDLDQSKWPFSKIAKPEKDFSNLIEGRALESINWGKFKSLNQTKKKALKIRENQDKVYDILTPVKD